MNKVFGVPEQSLFLNTEKNSSTHISESSSKLLSGGISVRHDFLFLYSSINIPDTVESVTELLYWMSKWGGKYRSNNYLSSSITSIPNQQLLSHKSLLFPGILMMRWVVEPPSFMLFLIILCSVKSMWAIFYHVRNFNVQGVCCQIFVIYMCPGG